MVLLADVKGRVERTEESILSNYTGSILLVYLPLEEPQLTPEEEEILNVALRSEEKTKEE